MSWCLKVLMHSAELVTHGSRNVLNRGMLRGPEPSERQWEQDVENRFRKSFHLILT